jgi:hypothetical protein
LLVVAETYSCLSSKYCPKVDNPFDLDLTVGARGSLGAAFAESGAIDGGLIESVGRPESAGRSVRCDAKLGFKVDLDVWCRETGWTGAGVASLHAIDRFAAVMRFELISLADLHGPNAYLAAVGSQPTSENESLAAH